MLVAQIQIITLSKALSCTFLLPRDIAFDLGRPTHQSTIINFCRVQIREYLMRSGASVKYNKILELYNANNF
jgi:hypothetical protein